MKTLLATGYSHPTRFSFTKFRASALGAGLTLAILWSAHDLRADVPPTALHLSRPVADTEGLPTLHLDWNAISNATYLVQSATNLAAANPWHTLDAITPVNSSGVLEIKGRSIPENSVEYFRLILPQPQIFSVEPAIVTPGVPVDFYVLGQCFPTNAELRINKLPQSGTLYQSSTTLLQPSFTPDVAGDYQFSLVVSGQVLSSFTVVCADALVSPELVLQGPPTMEPPASPVMDTHIVEEIEFVVEKVERSKARAAGGGGEPLDPDSDGDGALLSRKGYQYYMARSDLSAAGLQNNPYFHENANQGQMPQALLALWLSKKGYDYYQAQGARSFDVQEGKKGLNAVNVKLARTIGGGGDDCDDGDPTLAPALMKAKEKANRTKCGNNLRTTGVQPFSGEVQECAVDMVIPGRELDFVWARTYHSRLGRTGASANGWTFSYDMRCVQNSAGGIDVYDGTGRQDTFKLGTNGTYSCPELFREGTLSNNAFTLTFADTGRWVFNPFDGSPTAGLVHQVITRNGSVLTLSHNATSGRLTQVVDDLDRTNTVAYDTSDRLTSLTDFSGRTVRYEYDVHGDLVACVSPPVTGTPNGNDFPGGKTNRYSYTSGHPPALDRQNHLLLACVDALGQTNLQFAYQLSATDPNYLRCLAVQAGNNPTQSSIFILEATKRIGGSGASKCTVNDPVGNVTEYYFDARGRCVSERGFTGRATPGTPVTNTLTQLSGKLRQTDPDFYETQWTWNLDSLCTSETSPGGQQVRCLYQSDFDPATPARKRADCRVVRELASSPVDLNGDGLPDTSERVWRYDYDPRFGSDPSSSALRESPSKQSCGLRESPTKQSLGLRESPSKQSYGLRESPSKASLGFCRSATDPRGNVTTGDYDSKGNLTRIITPFTAVADPEVNWRVNFAYDPHGQVSAITNAPDANGYRRVDTFTYSQGQMDQCVVDAGGLALASSFEYDPRGNLSRYVDPRTNDWLFAYNALDQCVRAQSPPNISARCATDFAYDANDNLVSCATEVRDAADNLVGTKIDRASYDALQRLTERALSVDPSHVITNRFVYDASSQCVQMLGPDAVSGADPHQAAAFAYDERGLLFRAMAAPGSPLQCTSQWDYDANGNPTRVSDGLEGTPSVTTLEYDGFAGFGGGTTQGVMGQKAKAWMVNNFEVHPVSGKKMMGAPKIGEATAVYNISPAGAMWVETVWNKQCVEKDTVVRCSKITDPMGNVTTFSYDADDNLKVVRHSGETNDVPGSAGNVRLAESRLEYDALGRLRKVHALHFGRTQAPVGDGEATTTFAYAPNGACVSVTDDLGLVTGYDYDTAGRARMSSAAVMTKVVVRDRAGNVISLTETNLSSTGGPPLVFSCTYAYDALGRLVSSTDSAGNTGSCAYDSLGHVVRATDALGNDTTCAYDFMGDCLACVSYAGSSSVQPATVLRSSLAAYDQNLRCTSSTDANGNTTGYAYDTLGNCTLVTRPDGTQQRLVWSPRSNLQQATDPNGTVSVCTYDLNDRLVRRDITMGGGGGGGGAVYVEVFSFDGCARLVSHHDDDCDGAMAYDSLGNCVSETLNGLTTSSTYDALGNRLSLTYPGGRALAYAYDTASRCTGITESGQALASFEYIGSCLSKETCGNGVSSEFAYDGLVGTPNAPDDHGFGQVRQIRHTLANGSIVLSGCKVTWDQKQNKGARTVAIPGAGGRTNDMLFAYDALDQLVQSAVLDGTTVLRTNTYGFDRMGNRTNVTGPTCSGDYLLDGSALAGLFDFQMNQYTATPCEARSYDANGNLVGRTSGTGSALSYTYDYDDRLVAVQSVVDDGTGGTTITPVASYAYDALGRRTSKTVYSGGLPPATRQYCYDGTCAIEERQNSAVVQTFVHASGLTDQIRENDTVVFEVRQGTQEYFVHPDDQGNALALTGANGAVVERYDYDDYGAVTFLTSDGTPTSATSSAVGYPYCWGGLRLDPETGLLNDDGSGYLDPQTGRVVSGGGGLPSTRIAFALPGQCSSGRLASPGNNPWSGGGGGGGTEMKNGTVKFFNNPKGFGMVVGGSGKKHTKTGHVTLMK